MIANSPSKEAAIAIIVLCCISFMLDTYSLLPQFTESTAEHHSLRRALTVDISKGEVKKDHTLILHLGVDTDETTKPKEETPMIYQWASTHLKPISRPPDKQKGDTVLFWDIPMSGGNTFTSVMECIGTRIASKEGMNPRYGHHDNKDILSFQPWPTSNAQYVNVDVTSKQGIIEAKERKLVESGQVVSPDPAFAIEHLFEPTQKGRAIVLFKHPVQRLVAQFYHQRSATNNISLEEYAKKKQKNHNQIVKTFAGRGSNDSASEEDLQLAKRTIRKRFIVGLYDEMEESVHRFNAVLGIDEDDTNNKKCMDNFFHDSEVNEDKNSERYEEVDENSEAYQILASNNELDLKLYKFVTDLFNEQKESLEKYSGYVSGYVTSDPQEETPTRDGPAPQEDKFVARDVYAGDENTISIRRASSNLKNPS